MARASCVECWSVDPVPARDSMCGAAVRPHRAELIRVLSLEHPDKQLTRRMLDGEERAFEEFFEKFSTAVYRFAVSRLGRDSQDAEELSQSTLVAAVSHLETYRGDASLYTWLCSICRNEIAAFYKRLNRQPRQVALEDGGQDVHSSADGPEMSLRRQQLADRVHGALRELAPPYGDVLEWKYIDGLSAQEIANRLDVSVKAAESLLTRARKSFRKRFTRHKSS